MSLNGRKIEAMHGFFGIDPERRICSDCDYCVRYVSNRAYYKCELYGVSCSEATDWRLSYRACALIDQDIDPPKWVPVINRLKHSPRPMPVQQIPGQFGMDELLKEVSE